MANIITGCRILCSAVLLFFPVLSPAFYALYLTAGFTDMIDGTVARKTNTVSAFGSALDTVADFVFFTVCFYKLIPVLKIPVWLWVWISGIAAIKSINILFGFVWHKKFTAKHTVMNKIVGFLLFLLPLTVSFLDLRYSGVAVCTVATFAAVQEGYFIRNEQKEK